MPSTSARRLPCGDQDINSLLPLKDQTCTAGTCHLHPGCLIGSLGSPIHAGALSFDRGAAVIGSSCLDVFDGIDKSLLSLVGLM